MPKPALGPRDHTNPLIWCFAIICAVLAVAIIISGAALFIGYMVIKPKVPVISVTSAQLNNIYFDQVDLLTVQVTVVVRADNGNAKARASFYDTTFALSFRSETIAYLGGHPFELSANRSVEFNYVTQSTSIPLNPDEAEDVSLALRGREREREREISFELKGRTRSRWRVWLIGSLKSWLNLNCQLRLPVDGTRVYPRCSSKSH
ncbi:hypothetical protein BUALT_Bualt05G0034600 [Buddleja alternifolia]|uniref:Late embryogenesis abundant protein LEA-2 subgroup domain-containing protein n=1 Tax=Buddleja alternifolia TaxID=168488 RepID=A0AAV6XGD4_9LAMI|nr:hypothetical protein BUALT_Bualt05G0034600 [Buddleja alternifolia]